MCVTGWRSSMAEPLVTVVLPVYNAGRYLRQAVLSIVGQTLDDWELLIIDDASTDEAIEGICDIADLRIRIVKNARNLGLAATLNVGIDMARGEFIARMDQDDVAYPQRLERQVALLRQDPRLDLVAVRCLTILPSDEAVGLLPWARTHDILAARPWLGFYLPHPTWLARTAWFRRHRYHLPEIHLSEDQELLLRSHANSCFATVPEVLFAYRIRERKDWRKLARSRRAQLKMQLSYFMRARQFGFAVMSLLAFCARTAMDLVNALTRGSGLLGPHRHMPLEEGELQRWSAVRDGLAQMKIGS